jgi:hypothetical protein
MVARLQFIGAHRADINHDDALAMEKDRAKGGGASLGSEYASSMQRACEEPCGELTKLRDGQLEVAW